MPKGLKFRPRGLSILLTAGPSNRLNSKPDLYKTQDFFASPPLHDDGAKKIDRDENKFCSWLKPDPSSSTTCFFGPYYVFGGLNEIGPAAKKLFTRDMN